MGVVVAYGNAGYARTGYEHRRQVGARGPRVVVEMRGAPPTRQYVCGR